MTLLSDTPRLGDWMLEEVLGTREPHTAALARFWLWVLGTEGTAPAERVCTSREDAHAALTERAQCDCVDAWWVVSGESTVVERFRLQGHS